MQHCHTFLLDQFCAQKQLFGSHPVSVTSKAILQPKGAQHVQ